MKINMDYKSFPQGLKLIICKLQLQPWKKKYRVVYPVALSFLKWEKPALSHHHWAEDRHPSAPCFHCLQSNPSAGFQFLPQLRGMRGRVWHACYASVVYEPIFTCILYIQKVLKWSIPMTNGAISQGLCRYPLMCHVSKCWVRKSRTLPWAST